MRFKNPPIVEAVVGFTISELPASVIADFRAATPRLAELGFSEATDQAYQNFTISLDEGNAKAETLQLGVQFRRQQRPFTVRFLRGGFLFSQTGNYTSWEDFTRDARITWQLYVELTGITSVQTYQVRYINRLFIPEGAEWSEFVTVYPYLPPAIPQAINEYFCRLVMPVEDPPGSRLVHQQAMLPPEREGQVSFLLDNDFQFSALGISLSNLWKKVDEAREVKDKYFEAFVTDKTKEGFDA